MIKPKKSLGQHWLDDDGVLDSIIEVANINKNDNVLEVGPGHGSLTRKLLQTGARLISVEKDERLAADLRATLFNKNLDLRTGDILKFDLTKLPADYKIVANIPYYLTSNLIRILCESTNPPISITLLVQKEVAQRICAEKGQMSVLSVSAQAYYQAKLDIIVPAVLFKPPPKVDSQVVHMERLPQPIFKDLVPQTFFRIVKAGFSSRRKTLLNSLSGGLGLPKVDIEKAISGSGINPSSRPQELSLNEWKKLSTILTK